MEQKHFCTTTYIFNESGTKCLLIRHKKLPYYLPPGGHIDENEDYFASSQREVSEELGLLPTDLTYPPHLHKKDGDCLQPWTIQKYTISPNEHYHYDLIFIATADERVSIHPAEGESQDVQWFDVNKLDEIQTSEECRNNIRTISNLLQADKKRLLVQEDLYLWPRYDKSLKKDLTDFVDGYDFNSWNLGDIYDTVPCDFARRMDTKYGIFTSTGTAGLHAILISLGLKPGDEVIVPSMTFIRAVTPLIHLSLQPVVADINASTGNIDPESIRANITQKTKAVVVVHMWGVPADCEEISKICKEHGILMIEDFSHAHFSMYNNRYVGSYGDVSFASLQRKKNISVGEGGIVVTNNPDIYKRLQEITSPGSFVDKSAGSEIDFSGYGLNMRINPFGALIVKNLLPKIDESINDKLRAVEVLSGLLSKRQDLFELVNLPDYASSISWYSYKPAIRMDALNNLKSKKLWKFSSFGYPAIGDHRYWDKDKNYFPFCLGIKPETRTSLPGHEAYLKNRITLNIPTVPASYWTDDTIKEWADELRG